MNSLSILLPTYNCRCASLVAELHRQCEAISGLDYEIIVADDGSTRKDIIEENRQIENLTHVSYIRRPQNVGRACIRNFLAREAHNPWLLFIDGDRQPASPRFIANYLACQATDVACGGLRTGGDPTTLRGNLRYAIERRYEPHNTARHRQLQPYRNFNTSNFLVRRDILLDHPFDERFRRYGYEDVMWGKTLAQHGIPILHTDNPILIDDYETNPDFILKTEEGMHTLARFATELRDYSGVIRTWERLHRLRLTWVLRAIHRLLGAAIKKRLEGNKPSIFLFNLYKLTLYSHIRQ